MRAALISLLIIILDIGGLDGAGQRPVWPPPPDQARIEYVKEINCADLSMSRSLLASAWRLISGGTPGEKIRFPFDLEVAGETLFMTCRDLKALVEVDTSRKQFRLHRCESKPFQNPVALCAVGESVYITDSESRTVYRFDGKSVSPLIATGLVRPTGIAYLPEKQQLFVVDTGSHQVKAFDLAGNFKGTLGSRGTAGQGFNFPTFSSVGEGRLLINDTLNYQIKIFTAEGELVSSVGSEGDGPGSFARPKGVAADARGNIYVVDGLFDNIQIFNTDGRILLVVGSGGRAPGQFWSPGGIEIDGELIYIADTFNNRIQILRYIGG